MKKSKTSSFILTLPLHVELWQQHILKKRFNVARQMFNDCLGESMKRIRKMRKDANYKHWIAEPKSEERKQWLNSIRADFGVTEYQLHEYISISKKIFEPHIDINTAQKIASRVWKSVSDYLFGNGETVHFKKIDELNSLEGKTNKQGIRFKDGKLEWLGISCKTVIRNRDTYAKQALENRVKYVRIVREVIKGKTRYYAQLVLEGLPPRKVNTATGELKVSLGEGDSGVDIGTSTVAVVGEQDVLFTELAKDVESFERKKRIIQRKMDRSRRATNTKNYNDNGTIRKGKKIWNYSNRYLNLKAELKEINRKIRVKRKLSHQRLVNQLVAFGDNFYVERMSFKGLQRRAKKTTVNAKTGKINKKKRFGKSIGNKAPAMLVRLLKEKVIRHGGSFVEINTTEAKASQYNHISKLYVKKKLSERWAELTDDIRVQRDLYSAFLIQNINSDLETFNADKINERFEQFQQLHNNEMQAVKQLTQKPISMGCSGR